MTPLNVLNKIFYNGEGCIVFHNGDCIVDKRITEEQLQDNLDLLARELHMEVEKAAKLAAEKYQKRKFDKIGKNLEGLK